MVLGWRREATLLSKRPPSVLPGCASPGPLATNISQLLVSSSPRQICLRQQGNLRNLPCYFVVLRVPTPICLPPALQSLPNFISHTVAVCVCIGRMRKHTSTPTSRKLIVPIFIHYYVFSATSLHQMML